MSVRTGLALFAISGVLLTGQAPQPPPGISRTELIDNATVLVARLRMEPGARETVHTHPFSAVVIQLTPGDVDMTLGAERARAPRPAGFVWFVPREAPHAAVNAGTSAYDLITIAIKPTRPPAPAAPATVSPAGITRTMIVDNEETRVVRAQFAPASGEPVHTHPNDLVTVQLTPGRVEILEGSSRTSEERAPGFVRFLPRQVPHSYVSADTRAFELMSVAIK